MCLKIYSWANRTGYFLVLIKTTEIFTILKIFLWKEIHISQWNRGYAMNLQKLF